MFSDYRIARARLQGAQILLDLAEKELGNEVIFPGYMSPEWTIYVGKLNKISEYQSRVHNYHKLFDTPYSAWSYSLGFLTSEELHIDGEWVADLSCNKEEYCLPCIKNILMNGGIDPEGLLICTAYYNEPEYTVTCTECGKVILLVEIEEDGSF